MSSLDGKFSDSETWKGNEGRTELVCSVASGEYDVVSGEDDIAFNLESRLTKVNVMPQS